jgi:hypothetical protein
VSIRGKLFVCAAAVALAASGSAGTAAATPSGIYLSTWGTAHVAFGDAFKAWLAQAGASVSADAPVTLDPGGGGFTMPASADGRLDTQGRMVYAGGVEIAAGAAGRRTVLVLGPFHVGVLPELSWSARVSGDGGAAPGEVELAAGDYAEVLASDGSPSPTGFRAASVPFHLAGDAARLLARETGRPGPVAGSLFGRLTPRFDQVPTRG